MADDVSETVVDLYRRRGLEWDAARRGAIWNDRAAHVAFADALRPGSTVLDLGCGGGDPVARFLVGRGVRVTGVDASAELLALARDRLPEAEWIAADMRHLTLGRRFDGILAWDSFFHLSCDAQRAMLGVFSAHAAPDAVLMFNTGPCHGEAIGTFAGDRLYHASLDPAEYRSLLARHGFDVVSHSPDDAACGGRTVWLCRRQSGAVNQRRRRDASI